MARPKGPYRAADCHPDMTHFALGQCEKCYHRDYYAARKDKWRKASGYAPGQFTSLVVGQMGECFLCRDAAPLVADHDHETGLPRRPLCQTCNKALGMLHDDPELLTRAATYIAAYKPLVGMLEIAVRVAKS